MHEEKDLGVVISDKFPWLMNKMSGKLVSFMLTLFRQVLVMTSQLLKVHMTV